MSPKILFFVLAVFVAASQIECQDDTTSSSSSSTATAISTSLANNLSSIFSNLLDVKWRTLSALGGIISDYASLGVSTIGRTSKGASTVISGVSDTLTGATKTGTDYVANGLNSFGDYAQNYATQLSGSTSGSSAAAAAPATT